MVDWQAIGDSLATVSGINNKKRQDLHVCMYFLHISIGMECLALGPCFYFYNEAAATHNKYRLCDHLKSN